MSRYALLLPADGPPQVLTDKSWGPSAMAGALGPGQPSSILLGWSPTPARQIRLHGTPAHAAPGSPDPVNAAAAALTGSNNHPYTGAVLLTAHTRDGAGAGLTEFDLIVIGTRLLIGELAARAIQASPNIA